MCIECVHIGGVKQLNDFTLGEKNSFMQPSFCLAPLTWPPSTYTIALRQPSP